MSGKKIALKDLTVQSFVTSLDDHTQLTAEGGATRICLASAPLCNTNETPRCFSALSPITCGIIINP